MITDQKLGIADLFDAHSAQHLPHDDFNMLIVNTHALQAVNFLHLVDQILSQRLFAENVQDIMRIRRAVHQSFPRPDPIAVVHADMFALRNQILTRLAHLGSDDNFPFAFGVFAEGYDAVDFSDDRELFRLACFEEFRHSRQTAGNILGLGLLARSLGE